MRLPMPAVAVTVAVLTSGTAFAYQVGDTTYTRFTCKESAPFLELARTPPDDQWDVGQRYIEEGMCSLRGKPIAVILEAKVVEATEAGGGVIEIWRVSLPTVESPLYVTMDKQEADGAG